MSQEKSVNYALVSMGIDAACVALALAIATLIRPWMSSLPFTQQITYPLDTPWILYPIFSITWVIILLLVAAYDPDKQARRIEELTQLTIGSILAGMALAGLLYLSFRDVSRALFVTFTGLAFLFMLTWRFIARSWLPAGKKPQPATRRVLIIGYSEAGVGLQAETRRNPDLGLEVIGFVDDHPEIDSTLILGKADRIAQLIRENNIQDVVIASPDLEYEPFRQLLADLQMLNVTIWMIPAYYHVAVQRAAVEEYAGMPMLELSQPVLTPYQRVVKRAFDLVIGLILFIIDLPIMGIVALAIRLENPGPVLLKQQRVGENGQLFDMLKFRTMIPEADRYLHLVAREDEDGKPVYKSAHDPRITKTGHFLRRTSLDELPQLWNVLRGDMSLVGPRPELPQLLDLYAPWQHPRFSVPQGLTGWWQINGRSDKPMHLNTEYDLYYIQHHSLLLDIYILVRTIITVLRGDGAF
jgi:exopolysaccharide biosynthesis polyprenyl glycosylphosphotransferase